MTERTDTGALRTANWITALFGLAVLVLSGVAMAEARETLGEGDSVRITVYQNPDLTTEARITEQGTIRFPLVGEVKLQGLTPSAAETQIAKQLEEGKFVVKPQVNLTVTKVRSRQVSVLGQVVRPGRYPLEDPTTTLTDTLALAGGIATAGDDNVIVVLNRAGESKRLDVNLQRMYTSGDLKSDIQLENGDTIYVQRAPVFYIYGEVQKAGSYRLEPAMTVMQAIAVGGGITPRGTERGVTVRRKDGDGHVKTVTVALSETLKPDDVVYVKESLF